MGWGDLKVNDGGERSVYGRTVESVKELFDSGLCCDTTHIAAKHDFPFSDLGKVGEAR